MKIYIVENKPSHVAHLSNMLEQWAQQRQVSIEVENFSSGDQFLCTKKLDAEIVFLDIQMEGTDGITVARCLREFHYRGQIVFLTAFSEYVFDGYDVQALNYYLKPVPFEKISWCMDYVQRKIRDDHYTYRDRKSIIQIAYSEIICFSAANHYTEIITIHDTYRQLEPLKNILKRLPGQFRHCHRSTIVNVEHILMLKGNELTMTNDIILPVSKTFLQDIKTALFSYAEIMK